MIIKSTAHAKNKKGIVTLVGCAARLIANTGTLITQAKTHNGKLLLPQKSIAANVHGSAIPICKRKVITSHSILLDSWLSHQLMNLEKAFTWTCLVVARWSLATKLFTSAVEIACCITIIFYCFFVFADANFTTAALLLRDVD
jgi:hypothetical protein